MGCLGNVLWSIFRGCISGLSWLLTGCLWCNDHRDSRRATVLQICKPELFPFGKEGVYGRGAGSFLLNIIWLVVSGLPLAIESVVIGALLCMTVVGIPFGL